MRERPLWVPAALLGAGLGAALACALCGEMQRLEERAALGDKLLAHERERLRILRGDIEETRRSKHDLRHHLALLRGLLRASPERAAAYLDRLAASLPPDDAPVCGNLAVDCLLRHYIGLARREGVDLEVAVDLPEGAGITDLDLCVVFGNLLENALAALRGQKRGKRVLRVSAGMAGRMLAINVDNSVSAGPRGRIVPGTGKRGTRTHGLGLSSVRAVAGRYGGEFEWRVVDGMYRASVVLVAGLVKEYENSRL